MKATDTTVPKIELNYSYAKTENNIKVKKLMCLAIFVEPPGGAESFRAKK